MDNPETQSSDHVLKALNFVPEGVTITEISVAGAGNMNLVERVHLSDGSSVILKRSRGWVEKYPHIPAPVERAGVEAAFYRAVADTRAGAAMPLHLGFSELYSANLFQDLGEGTDGMNLYSGAVLEMETLDAITDWLNALHSVPMAPNVREKLHNHAMRRLNALHIFDFPLDPKNEFPLEDVAPALAKQGYALKKDKKFVKAVKKLGQLYLGQSESAGKVAPADKVVLLHGDFYPGSWLNTKDGLFVIDPEFCWIGPAEWDVGVLAAHMRLSGQPDDCIERLMQRYVRPLNAALVDAITGTEIMRRMIGVAQLPLTLSDDRKRELLDVARALVVGEHT